MKRLKITVFSLLSCLPAAPLLAQTTIGGGSCTSSTINGAYAVTLTGRQVTSAGKFTNVMQANGSATFDGQSKVTFALTQDNLQGVGTPLAWSGTYSVQANCVAQITIATGDTASFNAVVYNGGTDFLITGSDATYSYTGGGDTQPATGCSTAMLSGVYTLSTTGYSLASGAVAGVLNLTGLLQFDGQGHVTANASITGTTATPNITGTYSLSSNCLGTATLTLNGSPLALAISIYTGNASSVTDMYIDLAVSGSILNSGQAHATYGQPTTTSALQPLSRSGAQEAEVRL